MSSFSNSLFLGFEELERALKQVTRSSSDSFPPYNIERLNLEGDYGLDFAMPVIRITLAVAGFRSENIDITEENNKLTIIGKTFETAERNYLHRGIAARKFQRSFVLADEIVVAEANLENGLLMIDLKRTEPARAPRKIDIKVDKPY